MPLNWDDEAYDELDALPEEEAVKVFESLNDEERNEVIANMDRRAARKAGTGPFDVSQTKTPTFADPPSQSPTGTLLGHEAPQDIPLVAPMSAAPKQPSILERISSPLSNLSQEFKPLTNIRDPLRKHVGMPVAKKILDVSESPDDPAFTKVGQRATLANIAGPDINTYNITPAEREAGLSKFDETLPAIAGAKPRDYVPGAIQGFTNPVNLIPGGTEEAAASIASGILQKAPNLAKILGIGAARVLGDVAENMTVEAVQMAGDSNVSQQDRAARLLGAGVSGAVFKTGMLAAGRGVKVISALNSDELSTVFREASELRPDGSVIRAATPDEEIVNPLIAKLHVGDDGKLYGRVVTSDKVIHDVPINDDAAGIAWRKDMQAKGVPIETSLTADELARAGLDMPTGAFTGFKSFDTEQHFNPPLSQDAYDDYITHMVQRWDAEKASRKGTRGGRTPKAIRIEDPTHVNQSGRTLVIQATDGRIALEPVPPTVPARALGAFVDGDKVVDGITGEVGVLKGTTASGKLKILLPDGSYVYADSINVRSANENDVLSAAASRHEPEAPVRDQLIKALQNGREMNIKEAAAVMGLDEMAAREVLGDLEAQGLVVHDAGTWDIGPKAIKSPRPRSPEPAPPKPGEAPAGIAQTKGVTPTPPVLQGGPPMPGEAATHLPDDVGGVVKLLRKMIGHDVDRVRSFFKGFVDPQHRGPVEFHHHIREVRGAQRYEGIRQLEAARIRRLLPNVKIQDAFDTDLDKALRADNPAAIDAIMEKHGPAWQAVRDEAHRLINERNADDLEFKRLTGMDYNAAPVTDGVTEAYVARRYWAYTQREKWLEYLSRREDLMEQAIRGVMKDMPGSSEAAVAQELRAILNTADPVAAYQKSSLKVNKSALTRDAIPEHIRKLLGEHKSGIMNLAETRSTQKAIISSLKAWEAIAQDPKAFSRVAPGGPDAHLFKQVPNDPRKFGPAAGGFVREEIWEPFAGMAENAPRSAEWARALQRFVKGNQTAWNPRAHLRSWVGNMSSSVAAGGVNPLNPVGSYRLLSEAWAAMRDFKNNPLGDGPGKIVYEAKKYGGDYAGFANKELQKHYNDAFKEFDRVFGENRQDIFGLMKAMASPYTKTTEALGGLLDVQDQLWRVANYIGLRRKFMAQGMSVEDAARAASERINKYFWNAQNVGRHVENARNGGVGVVAPYLTPLAEDTRTKMNMVRGMASEDMAYKARMVAWHSLFFGSTLYGANAAWDAVQDEDSKAVLGRTTKQSETYAPLRGLLPYTDSKGRAQTINFTPFSFPAGFAAGNPDDALFARMLTNAATAPLGKDAGNLVRSVPEAAGLVRETGYDPRKMLEGEAGVEKILTLMSDLSLVPVAPARLVKDIAKTKDKMGPFDTPLTPGQVATRQFIDVNPVPANSVPRMSEVQRERSDAKKAMKAGLKNNKPDQVKAGKDRADYLINQEKERRQ